MTASTLFETVLIANRGEIACRIGRTLRRLGIRSAGIYSAADAEALHTRSVDVAVDIGAGGAVDGYLDIERVVSAARRVNADAIHPGYGFLAENSTFARTCAEAGIAFIGPSSDTIAAMGDKRNAKALVADAGVPTLAGTTGDLTDSALRAAAGDIGFPVIVKPALGGGGKGMHIVRRRAELAAALGSARRSAAAAFGDDSLLIEQYLERPRHIEVQVAADRHGNVVHLGERECSLQRRHQKLIEEAPAPGLSMAQRRVLGAQAVAVARACGYLNVGTVEFLVDAGDLSQAYFIEMNTRLQVEHPVTEAVWGVDLVEWQIRIAAGEELVIAQDDLVPRGWAIEARINAEDPRHDFVPSAGTVQVLRLPSGRRVRVDAGFEAGDEVSAQYDPLVAKVIASAPTRAGALRRLRSAMAETTVLGVHTNVGLLRDLLDDREVRAGKLDTALVERVSASSDHSPIDLAFATAAAVVLAGGPNRSDPWDDRTGWRLGARAWTRLVLVASGSGRVIEIAMRRTEAPSRPRAASGESVEVTVDASDPLALRTRVGDGWVELVADSLRARYDVWSGGTTVWVGRRGFSRAFSLAEPRHGSGGSGRGAGGEIRSPMPGSVVLVIVGVGDLVTPGQPVAVVEAMKMEHTLRSVVGGRVTEVLAAPGDQVLVDQPVVRIAVDPVER